MITKHCLTSEWINEVSANFNNTDKVLVEKVIRALLLLEGLAESKLPFVFKGGTALMILLNSSKRLSIDIDIIMPSNKGLDEAVIAIANAKGFTRAVLQHRNTAYNIEKAHYQFFYTPTFKTLKTEESVLLDVLFETAQYHRIDQVPMLTPFIKHEHEILKVHIPSFNDLLGDKLTAFAPFTTGIPYEKSGNCTAMEIIKQLYDIGCLFDEVDDLTIISKTFHAFAETELGYRNLPPDTGIVLEDIFQTSLLICTRGMAGTGNLKALIAGISQVRPFMLFDKYILDNSITHAAKTAYLAKLIQAKSNTLERFNPLLHTNNGIIKQPFITKLNKLKKADPEAFFYWYKIYEMLN
jgi:hypothetical protein